MSPNAQKYILAIDLGTSGPKVALISMHGKIAGSEFEPVQLFLLPNGGAEQDPLEWWTAIKKAAQRLLARKLVPQDDIVAVSCTTQWSGTVAVDSRGSPLMNAIIWMDARGAPYIQEIVGGTLKIGGYAIDKLLTWIRLTGGIPGHAGKDPIAHILFIKNVFPDIYQRTYKFLEPKDYINLCLTGKFCASYDSIALHWLADIRDLERVRYDDRLIELSEIDRQKLPDLKRAVDILGTLRPDVASELGLSENTQVVMGTPDVHSAALGSGAACDFKAHLYIGTSSWLACHVPFKKTDVVHNIASLPSAIPLKYLVSNEQQSAGACLTYLRDNLHFPSPDLLAAESSGDAYQDFDRIAEGISPGSQGLIFTPWLNGERTPVDDRFARGVFFNQSLRSTQAHFIRSVFEGVAYNTRWLLGYVEKFTGRRLDPINMVGGGAVSDIWCQIHADVLGRTIRQVEDPILVNTRGAAFLASAALGYTSFDEISEHVPIKASYQPNPENQQIYEPLYHEFVNLYGLGRKMFARLNAPRR